MKNFKLDKNISNKIHNMSWFNHRHQKMNFLICNDKKFFHDKFYISEDVLWYIRWDFSKRFEEEEMKHENF